VAAVELHLNSIPAPGYCQIDAVGILETGNLEEVRSLLAGANFNVQPVMSFTAEKEKLGPAINTRFTEAKPLVSYDGQTLYFARMFCPDNRYGKQDQQDIYFSRLMFGRWTEAENIGTPLNDSHANGVCSVSPDGKSLLLLNAYERDGRVAPGVSIARRTADGWTEPEKIEIVDYINRSKFQDFYLSADQEVLLMAVERPGTFGEQDLYVSRRSGYKGYSRPVNLGADINTPKADFAPFLAPDNATLYFASEGHQGFGESDIYRTRRLDDTWASWSEPENLGPSINTSSWEGYFSITVAGDYAYFVSSEGDRRGAENIYRISLLQNDAPIPEQPLMALQGRVLDAVTGLPVEAEVVAGGAGTGRYAAQSDVLTGNFLLYVPDQADHLVASAAGYAAASKRLEAQHLNSGTAGMILLRLQPLRRNEPLSVDPLLFVRSKTELVEEAFGPLEKLVRTLQANPGVQVELVGHTDALGSSDAKRALSVERAERVKEYLVRSGVDGHRIHTDGRGGAKPIAPNDREENRARNRRVEVYFLTDSRL
jgi:outer membrane protein OmpA-like peptidoglycan-associated protein